MMLQPTLRLWVDTESSHREKTASTASVSAIEVTHTSATKDAKGYRHTV